MPLDHLRLHLPARIEAVQGVEHQMSVIMSLPIEGHDGIEHDQIGGRRDDQGLGRRSADARRGDPAATPTPASADRVCALAFPPFPISLVGM